MILPEKTVAFYNLLGLLNTLISASLLKVMELCSSSQAKLIAETNSASKFVSSRSAASARLKSSKILKTLRLLTMYTRRLLVYKATISAYMERPDHAGERLEVTIHQLRKDVLEISLLRMFK